MKIVKIMDSRFLMIHGHQVIPWNDLRYLDKLQQEHQVDFIVTGHSHVQKVLQRDGYYVLDPGSFTGAQNFEQIETIPSFLLLKLFKNQKGVMYNYQIKRDQEKPVQIEKININMEENKN